MEANRKGKFLWKTSLIRNKFIKEKLRKHYFIIQSINVEFLARHQF